MRTLKGPEDARRQVQYWTDEGATSLKTYMQITRGELAAAINEAHRRGIKVTGHLCSVTYAEAAGLGIDNLEHGFFAATDFVRRQEARSVSRARASARRRSPRSTRTARRSRRWCKTLIEGNVALTSTLTVFETFTPGRPKPPGLEVLTPQLREQFEQNYARTSQNKESIYTTLFPKGMALERAFAQSRRPADRRHRSHRRRRRDSGLRQPAAGRAVRRCRLHAARSDLDLDAQRREVPRPRQAVGSLAVGKQADLVVINGNPAATIADIRKVETVFKQGVGYDPAKLIASVSGKAGIW